MPRSSTHHESTGAYRATPELEQKLRTERQVRLTGGRYVAVVARSGPLYEAWTENQPFAYGKWAESLQGALDSLEEDYQRVIESQRQAS